MRVAATALLASLTLAGCATSGDIRARHVAQTSESQRSVNDIAGCIALRFAGNGLEVGREQIANGISVTLSSRVTGVKSVMDVFDVIDRGDRRVVTLQSVAGRPGEVGAISGPARECL